MSESGSMQVVTFRLGEDRFAVDIHAVERVLRHQAPTAVPKLPDWVEGVIGYQDRVIPVLDLRRRFSLERIDARPESRILILSVGDQWVGILVDVVLGVESLLPEQLAPPPPLFRGLSAEYLKVLAKQGESLLIVLDTDRLLTSTERLELTRLQESASNV